MPTAVARATAAVGPIRRRAERAADVEVIARKPPTGVESGRLLTDQIRGPRGARVGVAIFAGAAVAAALIVAAVWWGPRSSPEAPAVQVAARTPEPVAPPAVVEPPAATADRAGSADPRSGPGDRPTVEPSVDP